MENETPYYEDKSKVYDIIKYPDRISGRCDDCGEAKFTSRIEDRKLVRKCKKCRLQKSI